MSLSKARRTSTKVGIALSADAKLKLRHLAKWIDREVKGNQDPKVRLEYCGGILTTVQQNVTRVSPMGALVQMFQPFELAEAKQLLPGLYQVSHAQLAARAAYILDMSATDYLQFIGFLYSGHTLAFADIAKTLRTLK